MEENGRTWLEIQAEQQEKKKKPLIQLKHKNFVKNLLRGRACRIIALFIVLSITIPTLIYFFVVDLTQSGSRIIDTCSIAQNYWVPCGLPNTTDGECRKIDCCFDKHTGLCYHYFPSRYNYTFNEDDNIFEASLNATPYGNYLTPRLILTTQQYENRLNIFMHEPHDVIEQISHETAQYYIDQKGKSLGIEVWRRFGEKDSEKILTTRMGPLIFSDSYTEFTINLHSMFLSGLGDVYISNNTVRNKVVYKNKEDHLTLPVFMARMRDAYHGLVIENSGPLEVTVLSSNVIVVRALTNQKISMSLLFGESPKDLRKLFNPNVPEVPPFWTLGPHICRDGAEDFNAIVKEFNDFYTAESYKRYVSDCLHENVFTMLTGIAEELREEVQKIKDNGLKFMFSLPPQIPTSNPELADILITQQIAYQYENIIYEGNYSNKEVMYPDFSLPKIDTLMEGLKNQLFLDIIDGIVLRDNFPTNENYHNMSQTQNYLPYLSPELEKAMSYSLPWNSTSEKAIFHYINHNNYGIDQENQIKTIANVPLLTPSSNLVNTNIVYVQHIDLSWDNFHKAIKQILYHGLFGRSMVSIPVCGTTNKFNQFLQERLCARWYIMSSTAPMLRISSEKPRRDVDSFLTKTNKDLAIKALEFRESLQSYYYSILSVDEPITRPVFYNYPKNLNYFNLTHEYMVGDALLVVQPLTQEMKKIWFYLPEEEDVWFDYFDGRWLKNGLNILNFVYSDWNVYLAPNKIIPVKDISNNKMDLRITYGKRLKTATGLLYIDKQHLNFNVDSNKLTISNILLAKSEMYCENNIPHFSSKVSKIYLYGYNTNEASFIDINSDFDLCSINTDETEIQLTV